MIKVAVFGIVASLIAMKIKTIRPEIAVVIAVISSILLAMYGLKQMEEILTVFEMIRSYSIFYFSRNSVEIVRKNVL